MTARSEGEQAAHVQALTLATCCYFCGRTRHGVELLLLELGSQLSCVLCVLGAHEGMGYGIEGGVASSDQFRQRKTKNIFQIIIKPISPVTMQS